MKTNHPKIIITVLFIFLGFISYSNDNKRTKIDKQAINTIQKLIPECEYFEGQPFKNNDFSQQHYKYTSADSTFIFVNNLSKTWYEVNSFFMKKTEVTNNEYMEFIVWVRDSIARTLLSKHDPNYLCKDGKSLNWDIPLKWDNTTVLSNIILKPEERFCAEEFIRADSLFYTYTNETEAKKINIYPDTLCWVRYNIHPQIYRMAEAYLSNTEYKNYPVVGVSYNQALAFCDWKTKQFKNKHPNIQLEFYLPSELEWLFAATCNIDYKSFIEDVLSIEKIENNPLDVFFNSNTSGLETKTGLKVIPNCNDGYIFTSPTKSYPPNSCNIFDLQGNVSEWTSTNFELKDFIFVKKSSINNLIMPYIINKPSELSFIKTPDIDYSTINNALQLVEYYSKQKNVCICLNNNNLNVSYSIPIDVSLINNIENFKTDLRHKMGKAIKNENHTNYLFFNNNSGLEISHETINRILNEELRTFYDTFFTIDEILGEIKFTSYEKRMIVKGGSWAHPATHTDYDFFQHYAPNTQYPFLGFRYCVKLIDN